MKGWGMSDIEKDQKELEFNPDFVRELLRKFKIAHECLDEITFYGLSRPREMGEGDDGDGHYKRIAQNLIALAANGRRKLR